MAKARQGSRYATADGILMRNGSEAISDVSPRGRVWRLSSAQRGLFRNRQLVEVWGLLWGLRVQLHQFWCNLKQLGTTR